MIQPSNEIVQLAAHLPLVKSATTPELHTSLHGALSIDRNGVPNQVVQLVRATTQGSVYDKAKYGVCSHRSVRNLKN